MRVPTIVAEAPASTRSASAVTSSTLKLPPFDPSCLTASEYNADHPDIARANCEESQSLLDQVVADPSRYNAVLIHPENCTPAGPDELSAFTFVLKDGTRISASTYVPPAIEFMPLSCTTAQPPSCTYHLEGYAGHPSDRTVTMGQASYWEAVDGVLY